MYRQFELCIKGILLCFFTFLILVNVYTTCMFGHKTIYKVTNLKVHSKGRYFGGGGGGGGVFDFIRRRLNKIIN